MKKILSIFTMSILASLLFTSSIINIDSNKTDNNVVNKNSLLPKKESTNEPLTHLFNNQYNYLTNSNWITNQSDLDQKFYSYDTNRANYKLSNDINAREVFFVDNDGNLNYDSTLILEKDKLNIENTKQEMINYKKVTKTKDKKNISNESIYDNNYFEGDNNNWQYIQFGGLNSHIDISNQVGAAKVEHSNNLNETLGLYYIVKAVHENKITKGVADSLGKDFISKISIKNSFNKDLTNEIINLIVDKEKVYKLINELPFSNDARDYSINYIFDKDNNLIEIYYHKFNNTNLSKNINIFNSQSFDGTNSWEDFKSENYTLINWTKYAKRWEEFCLLWPSLSFNNSYIKLTNSNGPVINNNLSLMTNKINKFIPEYIVPPFNDPVVLNNDTFNFKFENNFWIFMAQNRIHIYLCIWYDDNNIYCQYAGHNSSQFCASGSSYDIKLESVTFHDLSDSSVLLNKKLADENIYDLGVDSQGNIFRTQEDRVYKVMPTGLELTLGIEKGSTLRNLVVDAEDNVYVGSDNGAVYKSDGIHNFSKIILSENSPRWISCLTINKTNGIVYAGNDIGVYSIGQTGNVNLISGTNGDYIRSLAVGPDGSIYAGVNYGGKIYKTNGIDNKFTIFAQKSDAYQISSLVVDEGIVYAGSDNGHVFKVKHNMYYDILQTGGHEIKRLIIDRGGTLFAGVDSNQIYKKVKKSSTFCNMLGIDNDNEHILALTINSENTLYAAGTEGILYSNKNFK